MSAGWAGVNLCLEGPLEAFLWWKKIYTHFKHFIQTTASASSIVSLVEAIHVFTYDVHRLEYKSIKRSVHNLEFQKNYNKCAPESRYSEALKNKPCAPNKPLLLLAFFSPTLKVAVLCRCIHNPLIRQIPKTICCNGFYLRTHTFFRFPFIKKKINKLKTMHHIPFMLKLSITLC